MASLNAWLQEVQAKLEAEPSIRTELIEKKAQLARLVIQKSYIYLAVGTLQLAHDSRTFSILLDFLLHS